jgi:hypothetical protein
MDKAATPLPSKYLTGDQAEQDSTKGITSPGYRTPGPTIRLRGVEANTAFRTSETWRSVPEPEGITDIAYSTSDSPGYRVRED